MIDSQHKLAFLIQIFKLWLLLSMDWMDRNKEDMQQRTMDCETLNVKCVLGLVVFNSNQIYVT